MRVLCLYDLQVVSPGRGPRPQHNPGDEADGSAQLVHMLSESLDVGTCSAGVRRAALPRPGEGHPSATALAWLPAGLGDILCGYGHPGVLGLIDTARGQVADPADTEAVAARAVVLLSALLPEEIVIAQRILSGLLADSYRTSLWAAAYLIHGGAPTTASSTSVAGSSPRVGGWSNKAGATLTRSLNFPSSAPRGLAGCRSSARRCRTSPGMGISRALAKKSHLKPSPFGARTPIWTATGILTIGPRWRDAFPA